MVEGHGLDALFIGEHTHIPVATRAPGAPRGRARVLQAVPRPVRAAGRGGGGDRAGPHRDRGGAGGRAQPAGAGQVGGQPRRRVGGRVEVGVGYGWNPLEMANNGVDPSLRRQVFREKLAAVRRLWTEETVECHGRWVRLHRELVVPQAGAGAPPAGPPRRGGDRRHLRRRRGPGRRVVPAGLRRPARPGGPPGGARRRGAAAGDGGGDGGPASRHPVVRRGPRRKRASWASGPAATRPPACTGSRSGSRPTTRAGWPGAWSSWRRLASAARRLSALRPAGSRRSPPRRSCSSSTRWPERR